MKNDSLLGPWIRRFLLEHLVAERNLSRNTQRSYRDTLCLLLPRLALQSRTTVDVLEVEDLSADAVRNFLAGIEEERGCSVATHNQRLSAIHALAHFIRECSPEHLMWCGEVQAFPSNVRERIRLTIWKKLRSMRCSRHRTRTPSRVGKITRSCSSCTTLARGRARRQE